MFRNKTAAEAEVPGKGYDSQKKSKGPRDFLTCHKIKKITPCMIAYAALQASPVAYHVFPLYKGTTNIGRPTLGSQQSSGPT